LQKLTPPEGLAVIEAALQQLWADLETASPTLSAEERTRQMAAAAKTLLADYTMDAELTAFTALGG
jgi:hypothetical protein